MSPVRLEQLEDLRRQLEAKTRLCEVLVQVIPANSPSRVLLKRLRELGEDHIQFGAALRRLVDTTETEGDACAV